MQKVRVLGFLGALFMAGMAQASVIGEAEEAAWSPGRTHAGEMAAQRRGFAHEHPPHEKRQPQASNEPDGWLEAYVQEMFQVEARTPRFIGAEPVVKPHWFTLLLSDVASVRWLFSHLGGNLWVIDHNGPVSNVPQPSTLALMGLAGFATLTVGLRNKHKYC
ncbi:PEP-CTERM sorting domain-containing protein [Hahella aquimaris]|uniref:PEP-CTERM sorting domain-containing protein n=1 Tax=Hahella sp. HNIBRBA332 TaxID=3015983 RepID=UPI00273B70CE|nr:PEP-CTERM sorting domain-containing protein [Hahella sp. HNIBRBA332]WLQ13576.1 PEP-CTERM sorting domain-containing protein [Hahella sp. HNIBRBA332]